MSSTTLNKVNSKLKHLPENLLEEVDKYIEFLTFKYGEESQNVPQWHKDIVSKRIHDKKEPVDAFDMLDEIEAET